MSNYRRKLNKKFNNDERCPDKSIPTVIRENGKKYYLHFPDDPFQQAVYEIFDDGVEFEDRFEISMDEMERALNKKGFSMDTPDLKYKPLVNVTVHEVYEDE